MKHITERQLRLFRDSLADEEKAASTIGKYLHDAGEFVRWLENRTLSKEEVLAYKSLLCAQYAPTAVNTVLSSLNRFFAFLGRPDLSVKSLKIQRQIYASTERELTKAEYERLLQAAREKKNRRLYFLMQTVCSTGIRVSEVRCITVEAVRCGVAEICGKGGKHRQVFLPRQLCRMLSGYVKEQRIANGPVFVTKNGNPLDRSNIWSEMKRLCRAARVSEKKVFPHNLRHLFARTYYSIQKDIVRLADILGHASVNTTRIYTMESGEIHRQQLQRLGLLQC